MTIEESMSKLLRKKNVFAVSLVKNKGVKKHMIWKAFYFNYMENPHSFYSERSPSIYAYGSTAEEALSKLLNFGKQISQPE